MSDIQQEKERIRRRMKRVVGAKSHDERAEAGRKIAESLRETSQWQQARTVFAFLSLPDEPDTGYIIASARADGKRIAAPVTNPERGTMTFYPLRLGEELGTGAYGIHEPSTTEGPLAPSPWTLILVPGRAFDLAGRRVGRGGGYYDRYLGRLRTGCTLVGCCYQAQLVEEVPTTKHDRPVDLVVTEAGAGRCRRDSG